MKSQAFMRKAFQGLDKTIKTIEKNPKIDTVKILKSLETHLEKASKQSTVRKPKVVVAAKKKKMSKSKTNETTVIEDVEGVVYTDGACSGNGKISAKGGIGIFWRWSLYSGRENKDEDNILTFPYETAQTEFFKNFVEKPDLRWSEKITNQRCELLAIAIALADLHELRFWKIEDNEDNTRQEEDRNYYFFNQRENSQRERDLKRQCLLKDKDKITIITDSRWSIDCIEVWSKGWILRSEQTNTTDWMGQTGQPVKSQDIAKIILKLLEDLTNDGLNIQFKHVNGHSGIYGNMIADVAAGFGSQSIDRNAMMDLVSKIEESFKIYSESEKPEGFKEMCSQGGLNLCLKDIVKTDNLEKNEDLEDDDDLIDDDL